MREIRKFVTKQFGSPSGLFGKIIGNRMAKGNVYDARWTISLLEIQPDHRILEIGFGPGVSTQMASAKASKGFVSGIDHSQTMVQAASQRNADAIRSGRVELRHGDVSALPYPAESFDVAFSLHSIYFWRNPVDGGIARLGRTHAVLTMLTPFRSVAEVRASIAKIGRAHV